jgi:predicted transcriptional regulator
MLGIRLDPETEKRLDRHARELGRPKSVLARDWIVERLERDALDMQLRRAAQVAAATDLEDSWIEPDLDD